MRVERGGELDPTGPAAEDDRELLEGLLERASGPEVELEVLAVREFGAQRRTAAALGRIEAQARARALQEALAEMKSASDWRRWSGLTGALSQAAQSAIQACGGEDGGSQGAAGASGAVSAVGGALQFVFTGWADEDDRAATRLRAESEQRLAEARAAEEWLREARAAEGKLLERLEALVRAEHQGRMSALRG